MQRSEIHSAVILCARLCIAQQNLSIGVNVVSKGAPSRILSVLLISFGITILPKSSTLLTMPVAFIFYLLLRYFTALPKTCVILSGAAIGCAVEESAFLMRTDPSTSLRFAQDDSGSR